MKKKYKLTLVVIGIMLLFTLTISTGYGLWLSTNKNSEKSSTTLNCFKVYFSNKEIIEMKNIDSVVNEEGMESSPYTLTITNICETTKELQVRLNVLKDSTIDTKALTIYAAGHIEKDITLYNNLSNVKTIDNNVSQSKLIGLIKIEPNETVRTNIKMWFDEKKSPNIEKTDIFRAKFELIDTESSIKATFAETILNNVPNVSSKPAPDFNVASYQNEGLFLATTDEGKTYYYRGVVNNNYVKFANHMWRIVRINPDNSIRIILDKSAGYENYSDKIDAIDYTGYKYIYNSDTINNKVNTYLDNWYTTNITARDLDNYVVISSYCNDSSNTVTNYHTYFSGYNRLVNSKTPSITCPKTNADFGGKYNQKIGLITADEVVMAGGSYNVNNFNYYLYNGENFYTATPAEYYNYSAYLFTINNSGAINIAKPNSGYGIRPVINLDSSITVSGSGTPNDPYTIDMD